MGVHPQTVRRYIREGKLEAELLEGKFGPTYIIREVKDSQLIARHSPPIEDHVHYGSLLEELRQKDESIAQLRQELGVWQGRYAELKDQHQLMLQAPQEPEQKRKGFWRRLTGQ